MTYKPAGDGISRAPSDYEGLIWPGKAHPAISTVRMRSFCFSSIPG